MTEEPDTGPVWPEQTHDDTYFDRTLCACGVMHTRCRDCGEPVDECRIVGYRTLFHPDGTETVTPLLSPSRDSTPNPLE